MAGMITWVSAAVFVVVLAGLWAWSGYMRRHPSIHRDRGVQEEGES
jgi:hypothetical protein